MAGIDFAICRLCRFTGKESDLGFGNQFSENR